MNDVKLDAFLSHGSEHILWKLGGPMTIATSFEVSLLIK